MKMVLARAAVAVTLTVTMLNPLLPGLQVALAAPNVDNANTWALAPAPSAGPSAEPSAPPPTPTAPAPKPATATPAPSQAGVTSVAWTS